MHTIITVVVAAVLATTVSGCARARHAPSRPETPTEATSGALPPIQAVERIPSSTPKQAVTAYLAAAPEAYFSLEVTVVAPFVTERQEVREDAYIELNRQEGRALEMALTSFLVVDEPVAPSEDETSAIVRTQERWRWRYWDIMARRPSTEWATTTYRMEYTVERHGTGWLVASSKVLEQSGDTSPTPLP
ncbi:MAG: hypothetical protein QMD96_04485 [Anaerosomatales bacterium]|nr:hypothetical protein [Anaerosomatales bacterium]